MKVLIVGGGGREHALAWKVWQSRRLKQLFVAPGNAGTAKFAQNVPVNPKDIGELLDFALKAEIDLTVVGQDDPLALGIVDLFQAKGLRIFGPPKAAARIESSKVFAKHLMESVGVPTARFTITSEPKDAFDQMRQYFTRNDTPIVIKANGPALGKGTYVCRDFAAAEAAINEIMVKHAHGSAGDEVVIEEFVDGREVSIHAFCDGNSFVLCPSAQDHKPIFEGGPNTGGMGVIAPVPWFCEEALVESRVVEPTLRALRNRGSPFVGLLYPGLMMTEGGLDVLEYNARFGDPEAQVYMRLLKSDLLDILEACVDGRLAQVKIEWYPVFAVCIVLASAGYPSPDYRKGLPITGIGKAESLPGTAIFHAGTKNVGGQLVTSGGRVLGVTAVGTTLREALDRAYAGVAQIHFEGAQYRTDIGAKCL